MSDEPNMLGSDMAPNGVEAHLQALDAQLVTIQGRIREVTLRRAEANEAIEARALDEELGRLRDRRQALMDEQLSLQLQIQRATLPDDHVAVVSEPRPTSRRVPRARGTPPLMVRLGVLLLVLAGVGLLVVGGLTALFSRLQPLPIEGVEGSGGGAGDEFASTEGQSMEERALALYLSLNRDRIYTRPSDDATSVTFTIAPGESASSIATRLAEEGLILDAELFRRLIQYRGADQQLAAGTFELGRNMTMDEIIAALQQSRLEEVTFTLPEGWRAEQMAAALEEQGLASAEEYMALVRNPAQFDYDFLNSLPEGSTLEGFLFPDTFSVFADESDAASIIRLQLDDFDTRVTPALREAAAARGVSLYEAVTLASIVEREAVVAEERATIAGVYYNRLADGTVLNADPTIQYALGFQAESGEWWKRPLTIEDLQLDSPYNTYTQRGLPPSPIANPGLASIEAVILAPDTDFYYFVSRNDGTHAFAVTFEEHQQNVAQFQSGE